MTLDRASSGDSVTVVTLPSGEVRASLIRLGIQEGARITCILKMPAGPVVVRYGTTDVALGRHIASQIEVQEANDGPSRRARGHLAWRWGHGHGRSSG